MVGMVFVLWAQLGSFNQGLEFTIHGSFSSKENLQLNRYLPGSSNQGLPPLATLFQPLRGFKKGNIIEVGNCSFLYAQFI